MENDEEALIIEAGLPFMEVKKALNFNVMKIVGVLASHIRGDHAKYLEQYKGACTIYKPYEVLTPDKRFGNFFIKPFSLVHDEECYGFYLSDKCGDPAVFQKRAKEVLKYDTDVYVAHKGLEISLDLCPF